MIVCAVHICKYICRIVSKLSNASASIVHIECSWTSMQSDDCNKDSPIVCMMEGSQSINSCTTWRRNHLFLINFVQSSGLIGESQIDSICSFFSHCEPFQAKSSYFISSQVTSQVNLFPRLTLEPFVRVPFVQSHSFLFSPPPPLLSTSSLWLIFSEYYSLRFRTHWVLFWVFVRTLNHPKSHRVFPSNHWFQ